MIGARVLTAEEWLIVGTNPAEALIVRGGEHPVALKVSAGGDDLIRLLADANRGIAPEQPRGGVVNGADKRIARTKRKALPAPEKPRKARETAAKPADPEQRPASAEPETVIAGEFAITLTPGSEQIAWRGQVMELQSARLARFALALAKASPNSIDRKHLIRQIFGTAPPDSAESLLSQLTSQLRAAVAGIGLAVNTFAGIGIALQAAE